jgi:hypothetical protein
MHDILTDDVGDGARYCAIERGRPPTTSSSSVISGPSNDCWAQRLGICAGRRADDRNLHLDAAAASRLAPRGRAPVRGRTAHVRHRFATRTTSSGPRETRRRLELARRQPGQFPTSMIYERIGATRGAGPERATDGWGRGGPDVIFHWGGPDEPGRHAHEPRDARRGWTRPASRPCLGALRRLL